MAAAVAVAAPDRLRSDLLSIKSCVSSSDPFRANELIGGSVGQICLNEITARNAGQLIPTIVPLVGPIAAHDPHRHASYPGGGAEEE